MPDDKRQKPEIIFTAVGTLRGTLKLSPKGGEIVADSGVVSVRVRAKALRRIAADPDRLAEPRTWVLYPRTKNREVFGTVIGFVGGEAKPAPPNAFKIWGLISAVKSGRLVVEVHRANDEPFTVQIFGKLPEGAFHIGDYYRFTCKLSGERLVATKTEFILDYPAVAAEITASDQLRERRKRLKNEAKLSNQKPSAKISGAFNKAPNDKPRDGSKNNVAERAKTTPRYDAAALASPSTAGIKPAAKC